jgi:hypothetical protein
VANFHNFVGGGGNKTKISWRYHSIFKKVAKNLLLLSFMFWEEVCHILVVFLV